MTPRRIAALVAVLAGLALMAQSAQATIDPAVNMSPESGYVFPSTDAGTQATQTVTVMNPDSEDVVFAGDPAQSVTLGGTNPGQFSIANNTCVDTIASGPGCSFDIVFQPTTHIDASALVQFSATPAIADYEVSGTGLQGQADLSTTHLTFSSQVGVTSPAQQVTITNNGNRPVTIDDVALPAGVFAESGCATPNTLDPGESCAIAVTFTPDTHGAAPTGSMVVSYTGAPGSPQTVMLDGTATQGALNVTPTSLAFTAPAGGSQSKQVAITNTGDAPAKLTTAAVSGGPFVKSGCAMPKTLQPGASCMVTIKFSPVAGGAVPQETLTLDYTGAPGSQTVVTLDGTGIQGAIGVTPSALDFSAPVGGSQSKSVTITNNGESGATISSISVSGGPFVKSGCATPKALGPGASCTATIKFSPTAAGAVAAQTLTVTYTGAPGSPQTVALTGTGTQGAIGIAPTTLSFTSPVGTASPSQDVVVTNNGAAAATVGGVTLQAGTFAMPTNGCAPPKTLQPGGSCTIKLTFTPTAKGAAPGRMLTIDYTGAAGSPQTVSLSGTGLQGVIDITPVSKAISFPNTPVGATSAAQTVTVANTGDADAVIGTVALPAGAFAITQDLCSAKTLHPTDNCTVKVVFSPTANGAAPGKNLTIPYTGAAGSPQTVSLSGTGTQGVIDITPVSKAIAFPDTSVGTTSAAQTITVANSGDADAVIGTVALPAGVFAISQDLCSAKTLHPADSCTVKVTFSPTAIGAAAGRSVTIPYTGASPGTSQIVALSGNGTPGGTITIDHGALDFGGVKVNTPSTGQTVSVHNGGTASVTLGSIVASEGEYKVTGGCDGTVLAPGATCVITVKFAPTAPGVINGDLTIPYSGATDVGKDVTLTGTGIQPELTFTPSAGLTFSTPVGDTSPPQVLTIKNTGSAPMAITSIAIAGTGAARFAIASKTCGATLAAGASCDVNVTYHPIAAGTSVATLHVVDDAVANPHDANLSGAATVPGIQATPATLAFDPLQDGLLGPVKRVTIKNTGTAPLKIGTLSIGGTNPGSFIIDADACSGATVQPAATCAVDIRFRPQQIGAKSATVQIPSNAGATANVGLSGSATAPPAITGVRGASGCTKATVNWTTPTSTPRFVKVQVVRNRDRVPTGPTDGTVLAHGTGVLNDTGLQLGSTYNYSVFAVSNAYDNTSRLIYSKGNVVSLTAGRLCTPMNNARITDVTPLIDWVAATGGGSTYSVLLKNSAGTTIMVRYTGKGTTQYQMLSQWQYNGSSHKLVKGQTYHAYIYEYNGQYPVGRLIGQSLFAEV